MLLRFPKVLKMNGACTESIVSSSLRKFSQKGFNSKITLDRDLLYPFSQSQTSKALNILREISPSSSNSGNLFLIDKLTTTDFSETYRAYDFDNKVFVAQKNIYLDSPASWNQVNLILRQQQQSSPLFTRTLSVDFNEKSQNVKILSELQNTILKDYYQYSHRLKDRIRFYAMQIVQQLDTLKQLGIELEGETIDLQKIFIDESLKMLKLYDLSDFIVKDKTTSGIDQREFLETAKRSLMKIIDMSTESKDVDEISLIFKELEDEVKRKETHLTDFVKNTSEFPLDQGYHQFILDKLLQTAITKESSFSLNPVSKANKQHSDIGRDLRDVYIKHADAFRLKGDFKSATECYEKGMKAEADLTKIKEKVKSEDLFLDESLLTINKPKTGLEIAKNFGINVTMMVLELFFFVFGCILGLILFLGVLGLFHWRSIRLFRGKDDSTKVDEKEKKNSFQQPNSF